MSGWFNKGSGTILKFGGRVLSHLMPDNTWRFKFSDTSADPSNITPAYSSCASSFTWIQVDNNGTWDCLVTPRSVSDGNMMWYCFEDVFTRDNFPNGTVKLIDTPDTSNLIGTVGMFNNCDILTSVPLFNTSNVTSMEDMFSGCNSLISVPLFDTSNVIYVGSMFSECTVLSKIPPFDTSNVTDMHWMFASCRALTSVPLFDTSKVTDMHNMFGGCNSLTNVPLFDTSMVTNMKWMFFGCTSLVSAPLFDTRNVINMDQMFHSCTSLVSVPLLNTSNVTNMHQTFYNCKNVQSGALALYQQASSQAIPPSSHDGCFGWCGSDTITGQAELAQIPSDWK